MDIAALTSLTAAFDGLWHGDDEHRTLHLVYDTKDGLYVLPPIGPPRHLDRAQLTLLRVLVDLELEDHEAGVTEELEHLGTVLRAG